MRILNEVELVHVAGGDNPSMGQYDPPATPSGASCANSILFWSGAGSMVGGMFGAFFGGAGAVLGGWGGFSAGGWGGTLTSSCRMK